MGQSSDTYNKKDSDSRFAQASALNKYYTKPESDVRFAPAPALKNYYTKPESDVRFAPAPALKNYYTKPEIDSRFAPAPDLSNYYTKPESNSRFAPAQALNAIDNTIGSIQGAITGINNTIGSLQRVYDNRYVPTSALTSINNTIGSMQGSLTSINNTIGSMQGSLTSINNTIGGLQRVYDSRYVQSSIINDMLSKGLLLDKNVSSLQNFYNKNDSDKRYASVDNVDNVMSILSNNIAQLRFMSVKEHVSTPAIAPGACVTGNILNVNGFPDLTKNVSGATFVTCGANNIWTMTFDFKRLTRSTSMINIIQKYTSAPRNNLDCDQRTPVVAVTNGEIVGFRYSYGNNSRDAQCGLGIPNANLPWDNDWHNIIWQQNGRNIQIYLDGRRVVNHTLPADPVPFDPTRDMTLGTNNLISIKNFNYIPAYLLTENEIASIAFNRNF
jgi:hypothetical protein